MISGIQYNQGDILLAPIPFTDLQAIKHRPVIVISKDNTSNDVVTCGVTSNLNNRKHSILINNENLILGKLPKESRIKVNNLFTLEKSVIIKRIGTLNTNTFEKVKQKFVSLI